MAADRPLLWSRLIPACLAGFMAIGLWGAEALPGTAFAGPSGPVDVILLHDNSEIWGKVLRKDGDEVIVDLGMATISLNTHRIRSISYGRMRPDPPVAVPAPRPAPSAPMLLRMEAGCSGGWYHGELSGSGRIHQGAVSADFSESASLSGLRMSPGAYLRATASPGTSAPAPVLGLQIGYEPAAGASDDGSAITYAAVGGITWTHGRLRSDLLAIAGWTTASLANTSVISGADGATLGRADYDVDLSGWNAAIELSSAWNSGPWSLGLGAGLACSRLAGDVTWTSSNGIYTADEHISVLMVGAYASLRAGVTW